jgi:hypothetical protein
MNDTEYGLASGIWTADYKRVWRIAHAMEAGTVWINTYKQLSISAPFGGFKKSGIGREKGLQGVRNYQEMKSIYLSMSAAFDGGFTIAKYGAPGLSECERLKKCSVLADISSDGGVNVS